MVAAVGYGAAMGKILKGVLLGGAVGAGIAGVQAVRRDDPTDQVIERAAKAGAEAAVVGGIVAFVLDRRARRRVRSMTVGEALRERNFAAAAIAAKPVVEHALEIAKERAERAAEAAKPRVEHAAEVAKPKVEKAAKTAKAKAGTMAEQAKPHVIDLTDKVSERMTSLKDLAADGDRPKQLVVSLK